MLNQLDDYPVHQTVEPIAHVGTSDRNAYDRTWFNGYSIDGSAYFALGVAVYPNRGVLDAAFSVVVRGGRQHCFFGSRRAPRERTVTEVGPLRLEVLEPLRRSRVQLDDPASGLSCDLTFTARTAGIEEARQTIRHGARPVMDTTRFDQFGRWSGTVDTPDGRFIVDETTWWGTKDRSWGLRPVGEPEVGGAPGGPSGLFFLWAPLIWDDHITHAVFFESPDGSRLIAEGLSASLHRDPVGLAELESDEPHRFSDVAHRVTYNPGTRFAHRAELDLIESSGATRTIEMEPILRFQMKGLGYLHPTWGHGRWHGELVLGSEVFDPLQVSPLELENMHVQQVVRATDGSRTGIGVLEQAVIGPHGPSGFTDYFDGAPD